MKRTMLRQELMSDEDYERENGPVESYNINQPMEWAEFKRMPEDLQKEYLKKLLFGFRVNATQVAEFFRVSPQYIRKKASELGVPCPKRKASQGDIDLFKMWVNQEQAISVTGKTKQITITVNPGQKLDITIVGANS